MIDQLFLVEAAEQRKRGSEIELSNLLDLKDDVQKHIEAKEEVKRMNEERHKEFLSQLTLNEQER